MKSVYCAAPVMEQARALGRLAAASGLSPVYPALDDLRIRKATAELVLEGEGSLWLLLDTNFQATLGVWTEAEVFAQGASPAFPQDVQVFVWDEGEQQPHRHATLNLTDGASLLSFLRAPSPLASIEGVQGGEA